MRVKPDGFERRFTALVDPVTAGNSDTLETDTHHYQEDDGSPELQRADLCVVSATVSADSLGVGLVVDKRIRSHVHELHLSKFRERGSQRLVHDAAYYTLNQIPKL